MTRSPATRTRLPRRWGSALGVVAVLALAAACGGTAATPAAGRGVGGGADQSSTIVRAATLLPGQPVPAPTGKTVLTITGLVSTTNHGSSIAFDQSAIDRLGQVRITVYEPWIKADAAFRGVWLADLLKVVAAPSAGARLRVTALDDYRVELTAADVRAGGILLATKAGDGSAIPVADGGPTRLVFVKGVKSGANADQWIWSLKTIEIR